LINGNSAGEATTLPDDVHSSLAVVQIVSAQVIHDVLRTRQTLIVANGFAVVKLQGASSPPKYRSYGG
jgi:hypothetical protein